MNEKIQELQKLSSDDLIVKENNSAELTPVLVEEYLAEIDVSQQSKKEYAKALNRFFNYLHQKEIVQPGRRDIVAYKEYLYTSYSARTTTFNFSVLRNFFSWTDFHRIYPNIAYGVKGVRISKEPRRQALTSDQVCGILKNINRKSLPGAQKYAIVLLSVTTGLRAAELSNLNIEDLITVKNQRVLLVQGKGYVDKDQIVPIGNLADQAVRELLAFRKSYNPSDPIFVSTSNRNQGERLRPEGVARLLKRILEENGYTGSMYTGHSFRHTACCLGLEVTGSDLISIKNFMRHANVETTLIYSDHDSVLNKNIASTIDAHLALNMEALKNHDDFYDS